MATRSFLGVLVVPSVMPYSLYHRPRRSEILRGYPTTAAIATPAARVAATTNKVSTTCPPATRHKDSPRCFAIITLIPTINNRPHPRETRTAVPKSKRSTGTRKVIAKKNFAAKVASVALHTSEAENSSSDSSPICIPSASEHASAMAMVRIPPSTARRELVLASRPTIRPSVVITPDTIPKLNPSRSERFGIYFLAGPRGFEPRLAVLETAVLAVERWPRLASIVMTPPGKASRESPSSAFPHHEIA